MPTSMHVATVLIAGLARPAAAKWSMTPGSKNLMRQSLSISSLNSTHVFVAGGGGSLFQGPGVAFSTDAGKSWKGSPIKAMLCNTVKARESVRVAAGVSLYGAATAFHSSGASDAPFVGSKDHSMSATSTQDMQSPEWDNNTFVMVAEFNSWANGSSCSTPISPQCSGPMVSSDGGDTWKTILWGGTDMPGVDARYGAYPSKDVWYVSGGMWPSLPSPAAQLARAASGKPAIARRLSEQVSLPTHTRRALGRRARTIAKDAPKLREQSRVFFPLTKG
jgi:hypothetical protein